MENKNKRIFINLDLCIGCGSHSIACKIHHKNDINSLNAQKENLFEMPVNCRHCEEPLCLAACPKEAIVKDENNFVIQNKMRCVGCKSCAIACPFGVITFETKNSVLTKCDLCIERLKEGEEPACVGTCPTGALQFIDIENEIQNLNLIGSREIGLNKFKRRVL
ncbi:MAG TPA: 4Fe-4S binding protein [bacterium]|nr:4Fe-4S binding protein [bacterium]HOL47546.1 4Fe-4S binding protein [bacterium]HPQ19102.1 4Fe-4S binding protein [bacterium]